MSILIRILQIKFYWIFRLPAAAAIYLMHFAAELVFQIARLTPLKRTVAQNLTLLFPNIDAEACSDKLLRNVAYSVLEIICTPFFKEKHIGKICKIVGEEN